MGDDRSLVPDGYHYGAVSDVAVLGAKKAMRSRLDEVRGMKSRNASYQPSADTRRHIADIRRLARLGTKIETTTESRPSGDGFYFTPDKSYSFIRDMGRRSGGFGSKGWHWQ